MCCVPPLWTLKAYWTLGSYGQRWNKKKNTKESWTQVKYCDKGLIKYDDFNKHHFGAVVKMFYSGSRKILSYFEGSHHFWSLIFLSPSLCKDHNFRLITDSNLMGNWKPIFFIFFCFCFCCWCNDAHTWCCLCSYKLCCVMRVGIKVHCKPCANINLDF